MIVTLNGQTEEIHFSLTVKDFLEKKGISLESIAIALNEEVIPRKEWKEKKIQEGDRVEIVKATAGG